MNPTTPPNSEEVRRRAETRLSQQTTGDTNGMSSADVQKLLHELRVHKIELEMQNDELRAARKTTETALSRHTELYDFAPVGYLTLSPSGKISQLNLAAARLFGQERERLIGARFAVFVHGDDKQNFSAFLANIGQSPVAQSCEVTLQRDELQPCIVEICATYAAESGEYRAVILDITARKRDEARLRLLAGVFTHAQEGILITDASGSIVDTNDAFTRINGYSRAEAMGKNPRFLQSGQQPPEFYTHMFRELAATGQWHGEIWNRRKNGEVYPENMSISAVRNTAGEVQNYVALSSDISAIKAHQQQLEHLAHHDVLTHLPNRALLTDRLQHARIQCQRQGKMLAVAYLDLDSFKPINDTHGHDVGDRLLIEIARDMQLALREGDTLARIGGDEFVVVLVDLDELSDCTPVLNRLLAAASTPHVIDGISLQSSVSIGVTLYPGDSAETDVLLRHADQAMYQAKLAGRNRYHLFDISQDAAVKIRHQSGEAILRALQHQELELYYQPKVNMQTGEVVGAEALIRWNHPQRGMLLPVDFLSFIEDHDISFDLSHWVIGMALKQLSLWQQQGLEIPVSVNVSALQLKHKYFSRDIASLLRACPGIKPHQLQLEILETSAIGDLDQISELIKTCQELGVTFAIDDFGTGYSSLTYLRQLPVDLIKIDQSFVQGMLDNPDDMAIVSGVIGLANAFNRQVIAEGVETQAHGKKLQEMGCTLAQGYGIAQPMPAPAFPAWVAGWQKKANWTH